MEHTDLIGAWTSGPGSMGELVHLERQPAQEAIFADLDPPPLPAVAARLAERGITRLYQHQVIGIESIRAGRHTVLHSGTASGKTLSFQLPIIEAVLTQPATTALLVYPTKALARDQLASLRRFRLPGVESAVYDGDTPSEERARARRHARLVVTNPDMLHIGILPDHGRWADFFLRLRFVVIDEMHTLRGIFGSHVAMVLRRLRRVASYYGASPTFVFATATIGNPGDLASSLCGLDVEVIEGDGSPKGEKAIALWNPPLLDEGMGRRRSALSDATDLFCDLVAAGRHTIVFTRSRKGTELIYKRASQRLPADLAVRVAPYRAGYLPEERRSIERRLFDGDLLGVVATNALELGIDVGNLDAAVITTFPGTVSAFRQQAGRAGRARQSSVAVLVAGEDALDQYFMVHPQELFGRPAESAVVNPANPVVMEAHTGCAAYELPLTVEDREVLGSESEEAVARLVSAGHLRLREGRAFWARRNKPAPQIDIRTSGGGTYTLIAGGKAIGTLDEWRARRDGHPGAVYLHQGDSYLVEHLDASRKEVRVVLAEVDYYTQTKVEQDLGVLDLQARAALGQVGHHLGGLRVDTRVVGYQRRRIGTREVLATVYMDLPPTSFDTQGFWLTIPDALIEGLGLAPNDVLGALHAAEHAAIAMLPLLAICDRWDIGGLSTNWHADTGLSTIFIYEGFPGGAGISPIVYRQGRRHLEATLEALRRCACRSGCPSCVQSPKCGNLNEPLSKQGAIRLLEAILGQGSAGFYEQ